MEDSIRIGYFLEDIAHEKFIKEITIKILENEYNSKKVIHDVRAARGGSKSHKKFKDFIKDTRKQIALDVDILIVAKDGNCKGFREVKRELSSCIKGDHPLKEKIIFAIPDPHIEKWYLLDQRAFKKALETETAPDLPPYKCEKNYYKGIMKRFLKEQDINSLSGGAEYGQLIVQNLENLTYFERCDESFRSFVSDLKAVVRQIKLKIL